MKIGKVTDALAFVLENGEFTESILFAEDDIEELKDNERAAVATVLAHVKDCYVELLGECRLAFFEAASATPMGSSKKSLETKRNREDTIWKRKMIQVPVALRGNAWLAWVSFGLWPTSDPGRPIRLVAHISTQRGFLGAIQDAAKAAGVDVRPVRGGFTVDGIIPTQGQSFKELAEVLARRITPVAAGVHTRILNQATAS